MIAEDKTMFQKATRKKSKLRMLLTGPSGSGKTYSALQLAKGIVGQKGRIACIDTEHGSASLYSDQAEFDVLELQAPYSPERFIEAIDAAESAGYDLLIIDSMTHEWNGKGGILEIHDAISKTQKGGNSYTAWASVTPRHNAFVDRILQSKIHIICTLRSKTDFVLETNDKGKQTPRKVGMAPIQRDGIEYEFTSALDISVEGHLATSSKDRTRLFRDPLVITVETGRKLLEWLESGEELAANDELRKTQLRTIAKKGIDDLRTAWGMLTAEEKQRFGGTTFLDELKSIANKEQAHATV
jgi:energy-coupling factor transporter ATP-binding protein EcfA2